MNQPPNTRIAWQGTIWYQSSGYDHWKQIDARVVLQNAPYNRNPPTVIVELKKADALGEPYWASSDVTSELENRVTMFALKALADGDE